MTLFAGTSEPTSIMAGANDVQAVYAGSTEVWSAASAPAFVGALAFTGDNNTAEGNRYLYNIYPNTATGPQIHSVPGIKQGDFVLIFCTCQVMYNFAGMSLIESTEGWITAISMGNDYNNGKGKSYCWGGMWPGGGVENNPYFTNRGQREIQHRHTMKALVFRGVEKVLFSSLTIPNASGVNETQWNWPASATCPAIPASSGPSIEVCGIGIDGASWNPGAGNFLTGARGPAGFTLAGDNFIAPYGSYQAMVSTAYRISEDSAASSPGLYQMDGWADGSCHTNAWSMRLGGASARSRYHTKEAIKEAFRNVIKKESIAQEGFD